MWFGFGGPLPSPLVNRLPELPCLRPQTVSRSLKGRPFQPQFNNSSEPVGRCLHIPCLSSCVRTQPQVAISELETQCSRSAHRVGRADSGTLGGSGVPAQRWPPSSFTLKPGATWGLCGPSRPLLLDKGANLSWSLPSSDFGELHLSTRALVPLCHSASVSAH